MEAEPERAETYTVAAGDTLSAICRRFYGDATLYGRLAAANGIANPNLIHPGQVLRLPAREELPAADTHRLFLWKILIYILLVISTR